MKVNIQSTIPASFHLRVVLDGTVLTVVIEKWQTAIIVMKYCRSSMLIVTKLQLLTQ